MHSNESAEEEKEASRQGEGTTDKGGAYKCSIGRAGGPQARAPNWMSVSLAGWLAGLDNDRLPGKAGAQVAPRPAGTHLGRADDPLRLLFWLRPNVTRAPPLGWGPQVGATRANVKREPRRPSRRSDG